MEKVLCFGEILLRLSPDINGTWLNDQKLPVYLGGAELNVAQALSRWDVPVAYCSAVPDNYMSKSIRSYLEERGIDATRLRTSGNRIGIYYLAQGTDLKHAEVIYDRAESSTAGLQPGDIDWDETLRDVSWFHFSAISPAINENLTNVCREALEAAKRKNIIISVDLNYRAKLWKWGKQPREVMPELVSYCNVVMGNIWAAEMMLDIPLSESFVKEEKQSCIEQAARTSEMIVSRFPSCSQVANTFRFDRAGGLEYYGTYFKDEKLYVSREYQITNVADRVGSGDCFMAGLIYGNLEQSANDDLINFAAAAAVDKMFITGDATSSSIEEVKSRMSK